ncbi:EamA family transporter [Pusillimonas sp. T2]|uniref:EamA family transporter n=1 Tax=Pusillimonas sp. T2 TaxID=1548123 RepID=UPI00352F853B
MGRFFAVGARSQGAPIISTTSSFIWALPLAAVLVLTQVQQLNTDAMGVVYALLSGCVASGLGYAVWYWVRVRMTAIGAGAVQLSVPVISAVMGVALLDETMSLHSVVSALLTLGGVAWVSLTIRNTKG